MQAIEELKQYGDRCYTGKLRFDEWELCELTMSSCECWDLDYFHWFMQERAKSFSKKPSLPNMLSDVGGMDFQEFYDHTFMQEW